MGGCNRKSELKESSSPVGGSFRPRLWGRAEGLANPFQSSPSPIKPGLFPAFVWGTLDHTAGEIFPLTLQRDGTLCRLNDRFSGEIYEPGR